MSALDLAALKRLAEAARDAEAAPQDNESARWQYYETERALERTMRWRRTLALIARTERAEAALKLLDAMYRRIAPDDPDGTNPGLHPAWKACKAALAPPDAAPEPEEPVLCPCGRTSERECSEAVTRLAGCIVPDDDNYTLAPPEDV